MKCFGYAMATLIAVGAIAVTAFIKPPPRLIWNASASAPTGLYAVHQVDSPPLGKLVVVTPPPSLARWMAQRHYLPIGVPMLKHVTAIAGQRVCWVNGAVSVDGKLVGKARSRDSQGRELPVWKGCQKLRRDQIFLMNTDVPDSLDGRYFGPVPVATVIGQATPLLTRDAPDRRLKWRGF